MSQPRSELYEVIDQKVAELEQVERENTALRAKVERLRAALNEVEWFAPYRDELFCPWCGQTNEQGHAAKCTRAALEADNDPL